MKSKEQERESISFDSWLDAYVLSKGDSFENSEGAHPSFTQWITSPYELVKILGNIKHNPNLKLELLRSSYYSLKIEGAEDRLIMIRLFLDIFK